MAAVALGLQPYDGSSALSYRRGAERTPAPPSSPRPSPPVKSPVKSPVKPAAKPARRAQHAGASCALDNSVSLAPAAAAGLDSIRSLADRGELALARTACQRFLASAPLHLEALFLLALIETAAGQEDVADAALARLLFLDHDHIAALQQRAALARRRGDVQAATAFAARAERCRIINGGRA